MKKCLICGHIKDNRNFLGNQCICRECSKKNAELTKDNSVNLLDTEKHIFEINGEPITTFFWNGWITFRYTELLELLLKLKLIYNIRSDDENKLS